MIKTSVIIPGYNGENYIAECMDALVNQSRKDFDVIVVDNASTDSSPEIIKSYSDRLQIKIIQNDENKGFAKAVNQGIQASCADYVILLNNDTHAGRHFVEKLVDAMEEDEMVFSAQALMLRYDDRTLTDSAGDYFCALGVAFSMGKDRPAKTFTEKKEIFSACGGAAIYRKKLFDEIGYFDEEFFAYLEDVDMGYRARLHGYKNIMVPAAKVLHIGSATSGSRHNEFKVKLAARNSVFLMYKNFAPWQWAVNFLPVIAGMFIKTMYFCRKKLAGAYLKGLLEGFLNCRKLHRTSGVKSPEYSKTEKELFVNILRICGVVK